MSGMAYSFLRTRRQEEGTFRKVMTKYKAWNFQRNMPVLSFVFYNFSNFGFCTVFPQKVSTYKKSFPVFCFEIEKGIDDQASNRIEDRRNLVNIKFPLVKKSGLSEDASVKIRTYLNVTNVLSQGRGAERQKALTSNCSQCPRERNSS